MRTGADMVVPWRDWDWQRVMLGLGRLRTGHQSRHRAGSRYWSSLKEVLVAGARTKMHRVHSMKMNAADADQRDGK